MTISTQGVHNLVFWSEDMAGNVEEQREIQVRVDLSAPTISHTQSPAAVNGWNNSPVSVTFTCGGALSGIQSCAGLPGNGAATVQASVVVSTEGENQLVVNPAARAVSVAGNYADDPATVSIDMTAPTISASRMPAANSNGWNNTVVSVTYVCNDTLSGVHSCTAVQTLGEGANQTASGSAADNAGKNAHGVLCHNNCCTQ